MKFEMKTLIWFAGILLFGCSEETLHNSSGTEAITDADIAFHISYLASDALEGREAGSRGARAAGDYLASEFNHFGLEPAGANGSYFHEFEVIAGVKPGAGNGLALQTADSTINCVFQQDFTCLAFTGNGAFSGALVFAGYGIQAPKLHYDDYENLDVQGKIVLVLRNTPEGDNPHSDFYDYAPFRRKAAVARDNGAKAILFVTGEKSDPEDELVALRYDRTPSRAGIGVAHIKRRLAEKLFAAAGKSLPEVQDAIDAAKKSASFAFGGVQARLVANIEFDRRTARNVAGLLRGSDPERRDEIVIVGAHYDHLGMGGSSSLAREKTGEIHNGADDNASGTAGLLELAQKFGLAADRPARSLLFIAFSGEEFGLLGSRAYVEDHPALMQKAIAMLNMDMIGRMQENKLILYGLGTSPRWADLVEEINGRDGFGFALKKNQDGIGPSDHATFYQADIPVLALFTGIHSDYHKPSDDADLINLAGERRVVAFADALLRRLVALDSGPQFTKVQSKERQDRVRGFRVYVGTIPDYAETDGPGMKISGVSAGGPAEAAGLKGGDSIIRFGPKKVNDIYDYMYALQDYKPGDRVEVVVKRGEKKLKFTLTLRGRK